MGLPETVGNPIKTNGLRKYSLPLYLHVSLLLQRSWSQPFAQRLLQTDQNGLGLSDFPARETIGRNSVGLIRRAADGKVMSGSDFSQPLYPKPYSSVYLCF